MASLKKPDCCSSCGGADLHKEKGPERWICACGTVVAIRGEKPKTGVCRVCKKTREEVPFAGYGNICKKCKSEYHKEYRGKNFDKLAEQHRQSYQANKKQRQAAVRAAYQRSPTAFIGHLYLTLVRPSRKHHMLRVKHASPEHAIILNDIQITRNDLVSLYHQQDGKCAITGVRMCHMFGKPNTISIDRIDSAKGYTPDNVHLVCQWVNLAKSKYDLNVFRRSLKQYLQSKWVEVMQSGLKLPREFRHIHYYVQQFSNRPVIAQLSDGEPEGTWETIVTQLTDPTVEWKEPYAIEEKERRDRETAAWVRRCTTAKSTEELLELWHENDEEDDDSVYDTSIYDTIHVVYNKDGVRVWRYFRDGEFKMINDKYPDIAVWRFIPQDAGEDFFPLLDEAMTLPLKSVI